MASSVLYSNFILYLASTRNIHFFLKGRIYFLNYRNRIYCSTFHLSYQLLYINIHKRHYETYMYKCALNNTQDVTLLLRIYYKQFISLYERLRRKTMDQQNCKKKGEKEIDVYLGASTIF